MSAETTQQKRHLKRHNPAPIEEQYSPEQAAQKLGVNRATIRRWVKSGKIAPVRKLGRKCVRIPASAINAFLEANTV